MVMFGTDLMSWAQALEQRVQTFKPCLIPTPQPGGKAAIGSVALSEAIDLSCALPQGFCGPGP